MPSRNLKIFGFTVIGLVALTVAVFLYFFIYYTWQLKYGTPEKINTITKSLEGSFTKVNGDTGVPGYRADWRTFVRTTNPSLGNTDAPVTILMFIDFECPYCQESFPVFDQVIDTFGEGVRLVFKEFPISSIHPNARAAAQASMCANEQGNFWKFYNAAFVGKKLDESSLYAYATASSVNATAFDACMKAQKYGKMIDQDLSDGVALGVRGTPTYIVNGKFVEGVLTLDEWKNIIMTELNQK